MFFLFLISSIPDETDPNNLTVINKVKETQIVSLYIWGSGQSDKGNNWITTDLQPDSSVTFPLPSGKCNILAFDVLGNSYGIPGFIIKSTPDTITIDLEYITFGRPNIDNGHHLLNLTNSLNGFALDLFILSSLQLDEDIIIDDFRVFPGNSIIFWLDKGIYSISAVDQIGRIFILNSIPVPDDNCMVSISNHMITSPEPPIGITGNGTGTLLIDNCLPSAVITELQILPQNGTNGIHLDGIALQPGESLVANLNPGYYSVLATDESFNRYHITIEQQDTGTLRLPIVMGYLQNDFSFPESIQE